MPLIPLRPLLDNRLAMTGAIRKLLAESPDKFDPRDYLKPARAAMQEVCEDRMKAFGQAGHAPGVPIVSLQKMAEAYLGGKYGESAKPDQAYLQFKGQGDGPSHH